MRYSKLLIAAAWLALPVVAMAAPRTQSQMEQAAAGALATYAERRAPSQAGGTAPQLRTLSATDHYSVMGYDQGGWAIIAADDALPAVLAYSDTPWCDTTQASLPTGFKWWLRAIGQVAEQGCAHPARVTPKGTSALLTTPSWGQQSPYNLYCPVSPSGTSTLTGCVATAMAEIMYYWKYPARGQGQQTIYFPYYSTDNPITADFGSTTYDWDNMLSTTYDGRQSTVAQQQAVATLMLHCGVAAKMQYGTSASGAYSENAADGLKKFFTYAESLHYLSRDNNYSDSVWMDLVFADIDKGQPILYSGTDAYYGGHAFVLDGYDQNGLVHINWGWNGSVNGYYNIDLLNPGSYSFSYYQSMIVGIVPENQQQLTTDTIAVATPGTLEQLVGDRKNSISGLKVTGNINSTDLRCLREMAGSDSNMAGTRGMLFDLDLSDANIVAGGEPYLVTGGKSYTTTADEIPELAFIACESLNSLVLPNSVKALGSGFVSQCRGLDSLVIGKNAGVVLDGGVVYNADKTRVLQGVGYLLPDSVTLAETVTEIGPSAFRGGFTMEYIDLPKGLKNIASYGLATYVLAGIKSHAVTPPDVESNGLYDVQPLLCALYVPAGSLSAYKNHKTWSMFQEDEYYTYGHIYQFGSAITAKNATRTYGEANPEFGYTVDGEPLNGTPIISTVADEKSPVGRYAITVDLGDVTNEITSITDGVLKVVPADLVISADTVEREQGKPNPEFTATYTGFVNGEDASVLLEQPKFTTTATQDSPVGEYPIEVSGADALNYDITYVAGVLRVTEQSGLQAVSAAGVAPSAIYNLQGMQVRAAGQGLENLPAGVYLMAGKKILITDK